MKKLIGHQPRWQALARAFAKGSIPQTLLLSGPPHIGKTTLARRYTQLLLCPTPIQDESGLPAPCDTCRTCHQVEIGTFPDLQVFRPLVSSAEDERDWVFAPKLMEGSVLTIHQARKFGLEAMKKPLAGARKVMMLMQAERMTDEAQNCLLKTFEEPINGLTILLVCDNANHLRETIRSRCWHMPLGLTPDHEIIDWLGHDTAASQQQINLAVRAAEGRPGAAWRERERLLAEDASPARVTQAEAFMARIRGARPVAALSLTEEALKLAKNWWDEDLRAGQHKVEIKKADSKIARSSIARFLDELAGVYHTEWQKAAQSDAGRAARLGDGLDQIRKTRHYVLRNANTNLALDVLFGRLIASSG